MLPVVLGTSPDVSGSPVEVGVFEIWFGSCDVVPATILTGFAVGVEIGAFADAGAAGVLLPAAKFDVVVALACPGILTPLTVAAACSAMGGSHPNIRLQVLHAGTMVSIVDGIWTQGAYASSKMVSQGMPGGKPALTG